MDRTRFYSQIAVTQRPTFKKDMLEMIISLFVMSFGVVLSVKAHLGASPIASLPNVLSIASGMSLGMTVFIVYTICVVLQWVLLRDRSKILMTLTQLPFTVIFSLFVDFVVMMLEPWEVTSLFGQWVLVILSCAIIGLGIVLEIDANISMLADDGLVLVIHQVTKVRLDKVMIIFDVVFVATAFVLSYVLFHGMYGVGLGTIFSGFALGIFVKFFTNIVKQYIRKDGYIGC